MKKSFKLGLFITALTGLMLVTTARADDVVHYRSRVGSKVRIDGSANVHNWSMEGTIIAGEFDVPAGVTLDSTQANVAGLSGSKLNAQAKVSIPVNSLQSGTAGMDEVMQQAMNSQNHPRIEYTVSEMTLKQPHAAGTPLQFDTKGQLTVNGVTKPVSMVVSIENVDKMKLKISGGPVDINMTDYKVPPPTKFGLFTTDPDVKISFTWIVSPPKTAAK